MDDEDASCAPDGEENAQSSLLDLPTEVFLHICSFLDASTLVHGLSLVCKQFYQILQDDDLLWKTRIDHMWPNATHSLLRPVRPDKQFWKLSCVTIEKQTALWKQEESMKNFVHVFIEGKHYIDTVLLIHNGTTCIGGGVAHDSGTRNHFLIHWKLPSREKLPSDEIGNTDQINFAHNKEIAGLTAIDNTIYTCSGDHSVKSWMLTNTGLVHQRTYQIERINAIDTLRCMSSCPETNLFATGSWCGTICVFDSRSSINKPIYQYRPHFKYMTNLAMNTKYILSASEDKTVSIWDQRANRIVKSITIPGEEAYPTCMSMRRDWVCVGDSNAKLHMLNLNNDFELVKSYSSKHTREISGVRLTHGCLITSSYDDTIRFSRTTDPPKLVTTLKLMEVDDMDFLNDTLAICYYGYLAIWCPKSTC